MKGIITVIISIAALVGFAQQNTNSPYSIYGIGEPTRSANSIQHGMGNTGIAVVNSLSVNQFNPASYGDISRPAFVFDLRDEFLRLSNGTAQQNSNAFSIQNFSFAFPILNDYKKYKRRAGLSFGMTPFTQQGYGFFLDEAVGDLGNVRYTFSGKGSINTVHTGFSYDLITNKQRTRVLSAGANARYLFGTVTRSRVTQFDAALQASSLYREFRIEMSDFGYDAGMRFTWLDTMNHKVKEGAEARKSNYVLYSIGAYVQPGLSLNSYYHQFEYTFSDSLNKQASTILDTLQNNSRNGLTTTPLAFGVGMSVNIDNKLTLAMDLHHKQWSQLAFDGANAGLSNASRVAFGMEYLPDYTAFKEFKKTIRYRAGTSVEQNFVMVSGQQSIRYGINFGVGIPLAMASGSSSMFNLSLEYATRQSPAANLNENFFNIHAGFIITPNRYDRWFAKTKYD